MDQHQLQELLLKYRKRQCTPDEARLIDEWYDAITTNERPFDDTEQELNIKKRAWSVITTEMDQTVPRKKLVELIPWRMLGVAAAVIAILTLVVPTIKTVSPLPTLDVKGVMASEDVKTFKNNSRSPLTVALPDGSRVTLSPESRIQYAETFTTQKRSVFLEGEALFDVKRDEQRPFLVHTNGLTTQVLGTSFLVKAYDNQKEIVVTVKTGKVAVYKNLVSIKTPDEKPEEVILTPNQQLVYKRDQMMAVKQLVSQPLPVASSAIALDTYKNTAVIDILKSLEETYAIPIQYDSLLLSECTLTSDLSEEGFYEQIEILCNALGAEYRISEDAVTITATGCTKAEN